MAAGAGYAISQLKFPGRRILWWMILACFMVPIQALIVNHFILFSQFHLINTLTAVVGPQLLAPVTVIIYKQFFDSVPKEMKEVTALVDGANEFQLLFRIYLPMNWGITTALAIITFIAAWNNFLWPFLAVTEENKMNITVGITQVFDAFGVKYARTLATAILAGLPVAVIYLIFQRRVTQAIMLSAGIKEAKFGAGHAPRRIAVAGPGNAVPRHWLRCARFSRRPLLDVAEWAAGLLPHPPSARPPLFEGPPPAATAAGRDCRHVAGGSP